MLYSIILFFSWQIFAATSPELDACMMTTFLTRGFSPEDVRNMTMGRGQGQVNSKFRHLMATSTPAPYNKHIRATSEEQARKLSSAGLENAQYLPYQARNREKLEKLALRMDTPGHYKPCPGKPGTFYKFVKFKDPIGYDSGIATNWIRVEWSSGSYHGHPMNPRRLATQCPECVHK